ncbi:hypothetical protein LWI29_010979 [Acer saccharum]|uniref:Uncharacterized protein n=1 Tax=Acer saccharum TaxID=4024 RepID=A0AA39TDQ3_ACESA|nr:hypothetical protein LWI29_010979 [Acer saccharum]
MDSASDQSDSSTDQEESRDVNQGTINRMKKQQETRSKSKQQENRSKSNQTSQMNRSLNTTLDRPTATTIASWVSLVIVLSPSSVGQPSSTSSSAVLSHELSPCEAPSSLQVTSSQPSTTAILPAAPPVQPLSPAVAPSPPDFMAFELVSADVVAAPLVLASTQQSIRSTSSPVLPAADSIPPAAIAAPAPVNDHPMTTRAKSSIHKPIQRLNLHTCLQSSVDFEPSTVPQA